MHKVVFLDRATFGSRVVLRRPAFAHVFTEYPRTSPAEVEERLKEASIAITNKVELNGAMLARVPQLRLIAVAGTGTDCVDRAYCQSHDIAVT